MYDVCFRSVKGLPLPPRALTTLLIESAMARTLAINDVLVCNFVWMANHPHIELYSQDMKSFANFHGQIKKRLTDSLKRLLGMNRLNLWIDRTSVGEVLDLEAAIRRIIYAFVNPARARQAKCIDDFTGSNTWKEFLAAEANVNAFVEKIVPWIQATDIEPLSKRNPSRTEERRIVEDLTEKSKSRMQALRVYPFKWLEAFGITDPIEIEKIRQRIIKAVREEEAIYANEKFPDRGLAGYVITDEYIPPAKERSVFMYGSDIDIRLACLNDHDLVEAACRNCYLLMKAGHTQIGWPPECFVPPPPRVCNPVNWGSR